VGAYFIEGMSRVCPRCNITPLYLLWHGAAIGLKIAAMYSSGKHRLPKSEGVVMWSTLIRRRNLTRRSRRTCSM
jgi:hypothetical protein